MRSVQRRLRRCYGDARSRRVYRLLLAHARWRRLARGDACSALDLGPAPGYGGVEWVVSA